jgi:ACS family hexuronate transporter-like MFS transporter
MGRAIASTVGRYRWWICTLLFLATTINYIDRQILSLLKPILDEQLRWTNEQFGQVNSVFQGAYALSLLVFGWVVDRFGTRFGYAISIVFWSMAAIGHAFVRSVGGFFVARGALGLGEGGNFPAAIKAVALWFPKRERAFATSLFNAGTNVGAIVAPAVVPWMATTWGWRSAFVAAGIAGFLWLFLWLPFYDVPERIRRINRAELDHIHSDPQEARAPADPLQPERKVSWITLLGYRQAWSFVVAKFLTDPVWWFFLIWLPDFFKKTRGLDIKQSWKHLVGIYVIVTVLSILGGWLTGYLNRRGYSITRARKTGMFLFALAVLPIFAVTRAGDLEAVLLIGLAGAAHQAWSANIYTTVSDMFPKRAVASVIGIGGMAGSIGGMLFPWFAGRVLDRFQASAGGATAGYAILFGICGSAYLLAFVINHLLAPSFNEVTLRDNPGRLGRLSFALRSLLIAVTGVFLASWSFHAVAGVGEMISVLIALFALLAFAYQAVKRLHDLDRPASEFVWLLIPGYQLYPLIQLLVLPGSKGPNRYGDPPADSNGWSAGS